MLNNPTVVLHEISINIFEAFSPMLSQRCDISDVSKVIKSQIDDFFIDVKLDGERFQVHWDKDKNQFKYFSRCGNIISNISKIYIYLNHNYFIFIEGVMIIQIHMAVITLMVF